MNFSNLTISPQALPWLAWCLLAPALAAYITTTPGAARTIGHTPMLVLGAFFLAGVVAGLPTLTGRSSFAQILSLALPSVAGAATAYLLARVVPEGIDRIVHGALAFLLALAATVGVWLAIFLNALRRVGTTP